MHTVHDIYGLLLTSGLSALGMWLMIFLRIRRFAFLLFVITAMLVLPAAVFEPELTLVVVGGTMFLTWLLRRRKRRK